MKQLASILCISVIFLLLVGGGCGYVGFSEFRGIITNKLSTKNDQVFRWCFNGLPFVDKMPSLLANKNYLVLLQNDTELRPSGGFLGSYAKVEFTPTGIKNISVQDIYVPDGQLLGHVDPPLPIQQAFGQGWWKLRDANWDPDFNIAGEQIAWFFDQGKEKADGLIAVNLNLITGWLAALGPVQPLDYPESVNSDTLYSLAQKYSETNSFAGSTQKKDYLGAVGRAMIIKTKQASPKQLLALAKLIFNQLKNRQILIWFSDTELQKIVQQRKWDGGLDQPIGNYLYVVETNLGANKANCCVDRQLVQEIYGNNQTLTISWTNNNLFTNPVKPHYWGGDYIDFVRVLIPGSAEVKNVVVGNRQLKNIAFDNQYGIQNDRYQVETNTKFKVVSFWTKVPVQKSLEVTITYQSPEANSILVKRQPGIKMFDYRLIVSGKTIVDKKITGDVNIGPWTK